MKEEPKRERNTIECERFAERNGFTGMVAGHFPDIPYPPPPTFKPELPPSVLRLTAPRIGRPPRTVAERMEFFSQPSQEPDDGAA